MSSHRSVVSLLVSYLLVVALCVPFATHARSRAPKKVSTPQTIAPHREGELLVRFREGVSRQTKDLIIATHGVKSKKQLRGDSGFEALELPRGRDVKSAAAQLMLNPQVALAEPNFLISKDDLTPNDNRFDEQWALRNTGQNGGQFGSDANISAAWSTTTGSKSTVMAVIDSGIDFTHPDLANNQWLNPAPGENQDLHGWDYVADSGVIKDEQGHGTAVAGIVAAEGNNSFGVAGVMWRASLMSLRVLDSTGTGDIASAVEAIDYANAHGAQIINLSWGTSGNSIALREAIERAIRRDIVVVCSAGNAGKNLQLTPYYPASFDLKNMIVVAASDNFDELASWSNWRSRSVTVAAPGINILTTQIGGGYGSVNGTSAAAPIVAGIAGLLRTFSPGASVHQIAQALSDGARQTASLSDKVSSGGVVSASGAFAKLHASTNHLNHGKEPFSTTPPPVTHGAPGVNLPNLEEIRNAQPQQSKTAAPIESNLMCADCDLQGGGVAGTFPINDPNFGTARRRPINETGQRGVDLGSRNFNWDLPLLYLPGRAGLDLDLTLSYNSLVWTRDGSFIKFNADLGSPAPGFGLGLPRLQQKFLNSQTGIWAYLLVMPDGGRVELRQLGSSTIYESEDSGYLRLDVTSATNPILRTTNGTQLTFTKVTANNEYRCTQIKDRNGNYISATYNPTNGHLLTITDTLGRVITFVYDRTSNLQAIRQTWSGVSHDWATFNYGEMFVAPGFGGGLQVNGPNNKNVTVLTRVNLHDGSYFTFNYNGSFAQVNRINSYAADGHLLSYTSYNVSSATGQTDCPRFTERRDWAENWNNGNEALTSYAVAVDGSSAQQTNPDLTVYRELFATSGWQNGLVTGTEVWSGGVKKKWTTITWMQDDTNLAYQKNPRISETNVYDEAGNRHRMTLTYTSFNLPNPIALPTEVKEYAADASTVLRRTSTTYLDGGASPQAYLDRRVLGLVREVVVYNGSNQPQSKVQFDYDFSTTGHWVATQQPATQHDASGTAVGRGNVCLIGRWDVSDINNAAKVITQRIKYNKTGSVIATENHYGHANTFSYTDAFSDSVSRNTFAYPTTITDADGFSSALQYKFEFGAVTRTQDPKGDVHTLTYDSVGRRDRITNQTSGAYKRWVYSAANNFVSTFSTIQAGLGEAFEGALFDGAGRYRATQIDHPGSAGGYSTVMINYDVMGRPSAQSNPTEMNALWVPSGDDAAAGWIWTRQAYDWNGRPTVTTNPDGTTRENTYGGCGCAGGETTTVRDEQGRRKRYTKDVPGRLVKVEELEWDGTSVYSTTDYTRNQRDQITSINQEGQTRTFVYDGYGRLKSRTTPEQGTSTYSYFADDAVQTITDARGATTTFAYNNRRLPTSITFGSPSGVAATANVSFGYDSAANRTSMTDGLGSVSYVYNKKSQMTSETRTFTGLGSYVLNYSYNLGGQLNSITNHWGAQVGYGYDRVGRMTNVSGSGYGGISSYVSSLAYRAFGLKQMSYGNSRTLSLQYDSRLRLARWSIPGVLRLEYQYPSEQSGRVEFVRNLDDETLDRYFNYDHVGRLIESRSGNEARIAIGEQLPLLQNGPYSHTYQYDQWGNITSREGWGGDNPVFSASYVNNKRVGLTYDAAGNLINDGGQNFTYDAMGQAATASYQGYLLDHRYDGDGLRAKKIDGGLTTYYLRSSVLGGQVVAEISSAGTFQRGYVYLGGQLLAVQQENAVSWVHQDPVAKSKRVTNSFGNVISTVELDPWGGNTNRNHNDAFQPRKFTMYERDGNASDEAMFRRYNRWWSRFDQPDPYGGSYDLGDPQSFNRYAYVDNDPVNLTDPTGLLPSNGQCQGAECPWSGGGGGFWGGGFNINIRASPTPTWLSGGNSGFETILNRERRRRVRTYDSRENRLGDFLETSMFEQDPFLPSPSMKVPTKAELAKEMGDAIRRSNDCIAPSTAAYKANVRKHVVFPGVTHGKAGVMFAIGIGGAFLTKNPTPLVAGLIAATGVYGQRFVESTAELSKIAGARIEARRGCGVSLAPVPGEPGFGIP